MKVLLSLSLCFILTLNVTAQQSQSTDPCSVAALTKSADVVVIATVSASDQMPVFHTGKTPTQEVVYEPDQWLKGTLQRSEKLNTFTLDQPVVAGSATADTKEPRLNPALFARGSKLILFLHKHIVSGPGKPPIVATDIVSADCDVMEATDVNVAQVKAALK